MYVVSVFIIKLKKIMQLKNTKQKKVLYISFKSFFVEKTCTDRGDGHVCKFPFKDGSGRLNNECTESGGNIGTPWCLTEDGPKAFCKPCKGYW